MNKINKSIVSLIGTARQPTENRSEIMDTMRLYISAVNKINAIDNFCSELKDTLKGENVDLVYINLAAEQEKWYNSCVYFKEKGSSVKQDFPLDPFGDDNIIDSELYGYLSELEDTIGEELKFELESAEKFLKQVLTSEEKSAYEAIEYFEKQTLESGIHSSNTKKSINKV